MTPNDTALRAAENMKNLPTQQEKRELAHELCRYYAALLGGQITKKPRSTENGAHPNH